MTVHQLKTGDLKVTSQGDVLETRGVGSCVVICLWCPKSKIGGMAHMLLPLSHGFDSSFQNSPGIFPDVAIPFLLKEMELEGGVRNSFEAKLIGAGNMFPENGPGFLGDIGSNILSSVMKTLEENRIPIINQCVGGNWGRKVIFQTETGEILIEVANGDVVEL